jgi:hypothetical protein
LLKAKDDPYVPSLTRALFLDPRFVSNIDDIGEALNLENPNAGIEIERELTAILEKKGTDNLNISLCCIRFSIYYVMFVYVVKITYIMLIVYLLMLLSVLLFMTNLNCVIFEM